MKINQINYESVCVWTGLMDNEGVIYTEIM